MPDGGFSPDITVLHEKETRVGNEIADLGEKHIRIVATKPVKASSDAVSAPDIFEIEPDTDSKLLPDGVKHFVRVITSKNDQTAEEDLAIRTQSAGRADYRYPHQLIVKNKKSSQMSTIMIKGSGSERAVEKTKSPFCNKLGATDEPEGMASLYDLRLDAKNSKILDEKGIRSRLCLGVNQLDEIEFEEKIYTPAEFLEAGLVSKTDELPGIGVFAVRTPFKIEDVRYILMSCKIDQSEIGILINHLLETTQHDEAPEFAQFYEKHHNAIQERKSILTDFSLAFSRVMGRQAASFEKVGAHKTTAGGKSPDSLNNFTILAESVDNVGVGWNASIAQIDSFQRELLEGMANLFPSVLTRFDKPAALVEAEKQSVHQFIDGYLDEMVPEWKTVDPVSEAGEFINKQASNFDVDKIDATRAYWISKLRNDAMIKERGTTQTPKSDVREITYGLISQIFRDKQTFEKTSKFVDDFVNLTSS